MLHCVVPRRRGPLAAVAHVGLDVARGTTCSLRSSECPGSRVPGPVPCAVSCVQAVQAAAMALRGRRAGGRRRQSKREFHPRVAPRPVGPWMGLRPMTPRHRDVVGNHGGRGRVGGLDGDDGGFHPRVAPRPVGPWMGLRPMTPLHRDVVGNHGGRGRVGGLDGGGGGFHPRVAPRPVGPWMGLRPMTPPPPVFTRVFGVASPPRVQGRPPSAQRGSRGWDPP